MIDSQEIKKLAFLKVGETFSTVNDIRSELYGQADLLLEGIVETLGIDTRLLFNAKTTQALKYGKRKDRFLYSLPNLFLGIVRADGEFEIEGELIVSPKEDLEIKYLHVMGLQDYPLYMKNYVVLRLAEELCMTISTYEDKLKQISALRAAELARLISSENIIMPEREVV